MLPPGARDDRRQDREQRRRLGIELREAEREQGRDEEDPAADAEEARETPGREAEHEREEDVVASPTSSQIAIDDEQAGEREREPAAETRCWSAVPSDRAGAAGRPTSAACAASTWPSNA